MKEVTKSGKTVEEALDAALADLQTTKEHVTFQVVEEARKGFLGLGARPAVVEVALKPNPVETARSFLQNVTTQMGASAEIETRRDGGTVTMQLSAENVAILIGKRGNTLNALQYLTNLAANRDAAEPVHIILDAENYRLRREETLKQLALKQGEKVRKTNRKVSLDPMPSMERKIIHMTLKDVTGVDTYSDGVEPNRRVVITPAKDG